MKKHFYFSILLGGVWLLISTCFAIRWARAVACDLPAVYVWWVIIGIALLPGFLMSAMFFSNLFHRKPQTFPDTGESETIIMCAYNEGPTIAEAIRCVCRQIYAGTIRLLVVDNGSTDETKKQILKMCALSHARCRIEYVFCPEKGKANALNCGLQLVDTQHFLTVDADTYLEQNAVQRIMNRIVHIGCACVAGNLFVKNTKKSLSTQMQNYDYLLSIAAIKRFQGSYQSTLVAQGAFSAFQTSDVRALGGWRRCFGEDIVLTYQLLEQGKTSSYEPTSVGYTVVPETLNGLYNQRKRWAMGMLEGFAHVKPWGQGSPFSRYFTWVNLSVIYLDVAFLFGFIPGLILALCGYAYFVGCLTILALMVSIVLYLSMYLYQKRLHIPFQNSLLGFVCFLFLFQATQSTAALHGYCTHLLKGGGDWK